MEQVKVNYTYMYVPGPMWNNNEFLQSIRIYISIFSEAGKIASISMCIAQLPSLSLEPILPNIANKDQQILSI